MPKKRVILEMGMGNDLYGGDYTKAAIRAVEDAFRHSTLSLFSSLNIDHADMEVKVTVAVQRPDLVDCEKVAAHLPRGHATVRAVKGGLDVEDPGKASNHVIATAAIDARITDNTGRWKLASDIM